MGKTLLPQDFEITDTMRAWAKQNVPHVDIEAATEEWRDYWQGHGKKMLDWTATWRNGMRRAARMDRGSLSRFGASRSRQRQEENLVASLEWLSGATARTKQ